VPHSPTFPSANLQLLFAANRFQAAEGAVNKFSIVPLIKPLFAISRPPVFIGRYLFSITNSLQKGELAHYPHLTSSTEREHETTTKASTKVSDTALLSP
jgi:hypothetical protein